MLTFKNLGQLDRLIRVDIGSLLLLFAFFWLGGLWQIIFYILGLALIFTAIIGFCSIYKILKIDTLKSCPLPLSKKTLITFTVFSFIALIAGSYYSHFFTRKIFLEDYNRMNNYYKQTLFNTGQNKREESLSNYKKLVEEYSIFKNKYSKYHPYVVKKDSKLNEDLESVSQKINLVGEKIQNGDLPTLHKDLEEIRPIFQDILKRNNFSMLAVYLVDFHDAMEKVIEKADAKDSQGVMDTYSEADSRLKTVEEVANDEEIKTIRKNLDELLALAKNGKAEDLSKKASELKSSFVKVYLKRG